jgi:hypothetical protein
LTRSAVAVVAPAVASAAGPAPAARVFAAPAAPVAPALSALRRRLALASARESLLVDFLEDDLREAEAALGEVAGWLDAVNDALGDPRVARERLAGLAGRNPEHAVDDVAAAVASVRRRLAQAAAGLARAAGSEIRSGRDQTGPVRHGTPARSET